MRLTTLAAALLAAIPALAGVPESVDPGQIPNYRLIHPGLAAAGQPTPEALARLKEMGFRTVATYARRRKGRPRRGASWRPRGCATSGCR